MSSDLKKSISKNVAVLAITRIVTWSSTFVLMLFLPRYLGPVEYGRFFLGFSVVSIFALLIEFGGSYSITKSISRNREMVSHILVDSIAIRIFLWIVSFAAVVAYGFFAGYHTTVKIVIIIFGIGMLWSGARSVLWSCFRGFEMLKYPSYGAIAETVFIAVVGISAVLLGLGAIGFAIITTVGTLINFAICVRYIPKMTTKLSPVNWNAAFKYLKEGFPYFLNSIFGIIYYRIDVVMLSFMVPESVVGWYGASYKFFDALMFIPSIFTIAVFPVLSRLWGEGNKSLGRPLQKSLDLILLAGAPVSILAFVFSRQIIILFYGLEGYANSILLLRIFSVGLLLVYIDMMLGMVLLAADKQREITRNSFVAIFVNIGLNYLFIPYTQTHYGNGGIGAGIATLVTELFIMVMMLQAMPGYILKESSVVVQLKALGASFLMIAVVYSARSLHLPWFVQAILGSGIYVTAVYFAKVLEPSEVNLLRSVVKPLQFWKKET